MTMKKSSFLDKICKSKGKNRIEETINRLKSSIIPNYVFGGGSGAISVANMLQSEGVAIKAFFESEYFYKENRIINEKPVILYDVTVPVTEKRNLILGASGKNIASVIERETEAGNEIFVFDTTKPLYEMSYEWVQCHSYELEETYEMLEDELSKETFLSFIDNKAHCINGDYRPLWRLWTSSQYFNDLYVFDQYDNHALVDCGAWVGDTAEEYLDYLKNAGYEGKVYAFEPEPDNFLILKETAKRVGNIECFNFAVGNEEKDVVFTAGNSSVSHLSENGRGITVHMVPADMFIFGKPVSLIKMDLEGAEEGALRGLEKTIIDNSPLLAICVYHRVDDIIRLPRLIKEIVEKTETKYRYYLRHHSSTAYETVFYAVPDRRG